jgi:ASC-1-like (ASCH) protein
MFEKMLVLAIKQHWLDDIKSGRKKIEYRSITPYYTRKIDGYTITHIKFLSKGEAYIVKVQKIVKNMAAKQYWIYLDI